MGTAGMGVEGGRPHKEGMLSIGTKAEMGSHAQGALESDHTEGWEASGNSRVVRAEDQGKRLESSQAARQWPWQ